MMHALAYTYMLMLMLTVSLVIAWRGSASSSSSLEYYLPRTHMPHALHHGPASNVLVLDMIEGLRGRHGSNNTLAIEARQRQPGRGAQR